MWEGYAEYNKYLIETSVFAHSIKEAQAEAERLYSIHVIPLLLNYSGEAEFELQRKYSERKEN